MLQWQYRPERRGASWTRTIILQRRAIRRLLGENPSLRPGFAEVAAEAYDDAAAVVAVVIKVPRETFPAELPFTDEKLLDEEFWPSK